VLIPHKIKNDRDLNQLPMQRASQWKTMKN
jgi:hypothetical protein